MNTRSFLLSALIAGVVIGFFGNLPVLNLINCFLCIWVWLGAILAVFLYQRFQAGGPGLTVGQGAGLGAFSGLIGVLVGAVVYALTSFLSAPLFNNLANAFNIQSDLPFQGAGFWGLFGGVVFFSCLDLILYPLFGAIGGLIAASLFWRKSEA